MILNRENIPFNHKSRQISVADFHKYDLMLGMDLYNINELIIYASSTESKTKVELLGNYNPESDDKVITDPFFDNQKDDFEKCFVQISQSCDGLLDHLSRELK